MLPSVDKLKSILVQEPTNFEWSEAPDHTFGTGRWSFMDIWPDHVELAAIFPPDQPTIATHNAMLFTLVLAALRGDWATAGDWLASQLRMAARTQDSYAGTNYTQGVTFAWDKKLFRAVLTLKTDATN
jgi:hypothetical protein